MASQYSIGDISKYEQITKHYCEVEGSEFLPVRTLIDFAASEVEFNSDYVRYIINRRLHDIADYIYKKSQVNVTINPRLRSDIQNNNINREAYDKAIESYEDDIPYDDSDIYETIDKMIKENNWCVLYYLYYKEEEELTKSLIDGLNDFNDRKFFIIH